MTRRFFATRADLEPGIRKIEADIPLKYIAHGWHLTPEPEAFLSALEIPEFGQAVDVSYEFGDRRIFKRDFYSGAQKYLVGFQEAKIGAKFVPQESGRIRYDAETGIDNPQAFWFQPGGMAGDAALVGGCIVEATLDPDTVKLFQKFRRTVLKGFVKLPDYYYENWYVGPEALDLLKQGVRLTTNDFRPMPIPE